MLNKIKKHIQNIIVAISVLFNRKKRTTAILSNSINVSQDIIPTKLESERESHIPAMGRLRNITHMLDKEAQELYGRSPWY